MTMRSTVTTGVLLATFLHVRDCQSGSWSQSSKPLAQGQGRGQEQSYTVKFNIPSQAVLVASMVSTVSDFSSSDTLRSAISVGGSDCGVSRVPIDNFPNNGITVSCTVLVGEGAHQIEFYHKLTYSNIPSGKGYMKFGYALFAR